MRNSLATHSVSIILANDLEGCWEGSGPHDPNPEAAEGAL
jgi:hypothetical protein